MSSGLQFSSPRPVTKTSNHDSAACDSGAAASFSLFGVAVLAEELLAALAVLDAPASETPMLLTCAGTPVALPPKVMLSRPTTCNAEMLILPAAPMPASPALTVPSGATRFTSPGFTLGSIWIVRMPLPATAPEKLKVILPDESTSTCGGGAETDDLEPRPASILPSSDQIRMLPPPSVKIRDEFTLTSPLVEISTSPGPWVTMPSCAGVLTSPR